MVRVLQRWRPAGGWVTLVITWWTLLSGKDGFRPRPGASESPSKPSASNRLDQVEPYQAHIGIGGDLDLGLALGTHQDDSRA